MPIPNHREEWLHSIKSTIVEQLGSGPPTIERLASALRTSVRTLQRQLARCDSTYSTVVDQARLEVAIRKIQNPKMRLYDLAAQLGFADPGSFTRAFKRWTGRTPREFRGGAARKQARSSGSMKGRPGRMEETGAA